MKPWHSPLIYGMHEPCPPDVLPAGWLLFLVEVGDNPEPHPGIDLSAYSGYGCIVRLQYSWGGGGTFPKPDRLGAYLGRVRSCVSNSPDAHIWQVGNEPNHPNEWADDFRYQPPYVADVYDRARVIIHDVPGHESDEVLLPPIAPWVDLIGVDWIEYFKRVVALCDRVGGFALHTYSRGADPASITSQDKMESYPQYYNGWPTLYDWLDAIPDVYRDRPVYLTETNQLDPWSEVNTGWVRELYREVNRHNQSGGQVVRCALLYRWPHYDQWGIEGNQAVISDFKAAQAAGYTWTETEPPQEDTMLNPGLELPYYRDSQNSTVEVAHDWTYFASDGKPPERDGPCQLPEYKALSRSEDARRVVEGNTAQCWFIRWKIMDAGIYQRIPSEIGASYSFDAMCQAWCSNSDDPTVSDGDMHVMLGVDVLGGADPWSPFVEWSNWQRVGADYKRFVSPTVQAQASHITVFIRAWNKWELSHNDVYVDDCHLVKEGGGTPPGGGEPVDYERIRAIVREELDRTVWASGTQ